MSAISTYATKSGHIADCHIGILFHYQGFPYSTLLSAMCQRLTSHPNTAKRHRNQSHDPHESTNEDTPMTY